MNLKTLAGTCQTLKTSTDLEELIDSLPTKAIKASKYSGFSATGAILFSKNTGYFVKQTNFFEKKNVFSVRNKKKCIFAPNYTRHMATQLFAYSYYFYFSWTS
jgi:hypothetical protein